LQPLQSCNDTACAGGSLPLQPHCTCFYCCIEELSAAALHAAILLAGAAELQ
jgi:hypothetical protein